MRNLQGFEIGRGGVTASGQPQYQKFNAQQPVIQQPVPPVPPVVTPPGRGSRGSTTGGIPVIGGSTLGDPSKIPTSVPGNEGAWFNIGVPGQEWSRKNVQRDEHGFTTGEVLAAREELDAGGT